MNIKEKILQSLVDGPKTSSQLIKLTNSSKSSVSDMRRTLMRHGLVKKCGETATNNGGTGYEGVYCLVVNKIQKKEAINAFDWRNWNSPPMYSERELAYSYASFANKKEGRVIVYSRA